MYYFYFSFVIVLSLLMFAECYYRNRPRWWAVMVLLAPVTMPYFIFKTRKQAGIIMFFIFLSTFSAVCALEGFLFVRQMNENKYADLPPVARKIIYFSKQVKESTIKLDKALTTLETMSKVEGQLKKIKETLDFIKTVRSTMRENRTAINQLVKYTAGNQKMFKSNELEWVFDIEKYYDNWNVVQHYESLEGYLNDFEELLEYIYINFHKIKKHKIQKQLKNYDELYLRYRHSVDAHNRFNVRRIDFQNKFLKQYPDIKSYLPGERQTETFKLWE